jgi:hypothetical protein
VSEGLEPELGELDGAGGRSVVVAAGGGCAVDPMADMGSAVDVGEASVVPASPVVSLLPVAELAPADGAVPVAVLLTLVEATPVAMGVGAAPSGVVSDGAGAVVVTGAVTVGDVVVGSDPAGVVVAAAEVVVVTVVAAVVPVAAIGVVVVIGVVVEPVVVVVCGLVVVPDGATVCVAESPWLAVSVCVSPLQLLRHPEIWVCPITWVVVLVTAGGASAWAESVSPGATASAAEIRSSLARRGIATAGHHAPISRRSAGTLLLVARLAGSGRVACAAERAVAGGLVGA